MKLLQPYTLGSLKLKNRMVMAAMTRSRADSDGIVGAMTAEYYAQRASSGLILSEAVNISADALGAVCIGFVKQFFEKKFADARKKAQQG